MNTFKNVEVILARSFDDLFALRSPYTGKPCVVTVEQTASDVPLAGIPGQDDNFRATLVHIVASDSTGDYKALAVVSPEFSQALELVYGQ